MINVSGFKNASIQLDLFAADEVLIALSGGLDSMVLLYFANKYFSKVHAAHCNFSLRGEESDADAEFVKTICSEWKIPCTVKCLDTKRYSAKNHLSIQEAARELRYTWFEDLRLELNAAAILTAHHKDDNIETFFINLLRGSGIKGLGGIPEKNGYVKRPLLNFSKTELYAFAIENKIPFREDSSNADDKYLRNRIRHHLIPQIKEIDPEALDRVSLSIGFLKASNEFVERQALDFIDNHFVKSSEDFKINMSDWKTLASAPVLMHAVLTKFNFSPGEIEELSFVENSQSGKQLVSKTYQAVKDRERVLFIRNGNEIGEEEINLETYEGEITKPISLKWTRLETRIPQITDSQTALLDAGKLRFPLRIRRWKPADKFTPLGMKGKKKLSDFLIDQKVPLPEKDKVYVMLSQDEIAWVVGHRIDDRFKITSDTKSTLKFHLPANEIHGE